MTDLAHIPSSSDADRLMKALLTIARLQTAHAQMQQTLDRLTAERDYERRQSDHLRTVVDKLNATITRSNIERNSLVEDLDMVTAERDAMREALECISAKGYYLMVGNTAQTVARAALSPATPPATDMGDDHGKMVKPKPGAPAGGYDGGPRSNKDTDHG